MSDDIVIVAATRTAIGSFGGSLSATPAPTLGGEVLKGALKKAALSPESIDEVIMGCVLPAGLGQAPARQVLRHAGIPDSSGATTVNKVCGSGMKAVMIACDMIKAGSASIVAAGGMENMSLSPYLMPGARTGLRFGHSEIKDHMLLDGLQDAYEGEAMGCFADKTAASGNFSREDQDAFALESHKRAMAAIEAGQFKDEITAIEIKSKKETVSFEVDETPLKVRPEKIPTLKPAFSKEGTVTAANASSISDGAAALILMKESQAKEKSLPIIAHVKGYVSAGRVPEEFTLAPINALKKLSEQTGWALSDVDLFEINEAFAVVTMAAMKELSLPHEKVNVFGGACALGHPIGASGARILVTLLNALEKQGKTKGMATLCIGGGEATALAVERV